MDDACRTIIKVPVDRRNRRFLPLGVTGNTPDSGSGESWFDPRRGNYEPDNTLCAVGLLRFRLGVAVSESVRSADGHRHQLSPLVRFAGHLEHILIAR